MLEVLAEPPFIPPPHSRDVIDGNVTNQSQKYRKWNYWQMGQCVGATLYQTFSAGFSLAVYVLFYILADMLNIRIGVFRTPRAPVREQFSNAELIREYQRIVHELGRLPREIEFDRKANCSYATLKKRFGGAAGIHRAFRVTEEADASAREAANEPSLFRQSEHSPKPLPMGPEYLRREWAQVRIAFAVTSNEYRGQESLDFDLLFCLNHNWPPCPCKVIELREVCQNPRGH